MYLLHINHICLKGEGSRRNEWHRAKVRWGARGRQGLGDLESRKLVGDGPESKKQGHAVENRTKIRRHRGENRSGSAGIERNGY